MLSHLKKIHFIGIGGIGMSGIAELLHKKGFIISGSDISSCFAIVRLCTKPLFLTATLDLGVCTLVKRTSGSGKSI